MKKTGIDLLHDPSLNKSTAFTSVAFNAIPFSLFYNAPGPFGYPATT